jgi:hypothetical protein
MNGMVGTPQPGTGMSSYDWFDAILSDYQSQTGRSVPAKLVYVEYRFDPGAIGESGLSQELENITDPNASKRVIHREITGMVQNLAQLSFVAKRIIPGLRELTSAEQGNLRQYYKKLYRKV